MITKHDLTTRDLTCDHDLDDDYETNSRLDDFSISHEKVIQTLFLFFFFFVLFGTVLGIGNGIGWTGQDRSREMDTGMAPSMNYEGMDMDMVTDFGTNINDGRITGYDAQLCGMFGHGKGQNCERTQGYGRA